MIITDFSWSAYQFAINRRSLPGNNTWCSVQYGRFLPRDAMLSAVHAVVVYLSVVRSVCVCVCVSVTLRYCVKTAKHRITHSSFQMGYFVVAEFLLTSASRGSSAIAEPLVYTGGWRWWSYKLNFRTRPLLFWSFTEIVNSFANVFLKCQFKPTYKDVFWNLE